MNQTLSEALKKGCLCRYPKVQKGKPFRTCMSCQLTIVDWSGKDGFYQVEIIPAPLMSRKLNGPTHFSKN